MNDMKIAVLITFFAVVGFLMWYFLTQSGETTPKTFWDVVRNPEFVTDFDALEEHIEEQTNQLRGNPTAIAELVDEYVFESNPSSPAQEQVLAALGDEAFPRAIGILKDETHHDDLVAKVDFDFGGSHPFERLCELFDVEGQLPEDLGNTLTSYARSSNEDVRKEAALVIGSLGDPELIPALRSLLSDSDEYVRNYALMGIRRAVSRNRVAAEESTKFFELVEALWPHQHDSGVPSVLIQLDRERATKRFLRPDVFDVDSDALRDILRVTAEHRVDIPRQRVLDVIAELRTAEIGHKRRRVLAEALELLGTYENDSDRAILEEFTEHDHDRIVSAAARGLSKLTGVKQRAVWERAMEEGIEALSLPERYQFTVEYLNAEVNNGGFAQYFFNSSGDNWPIALEGLKAIGAKQRAELLQATLDRFPNQLPSTDNDARRQQLAKVAAKGDPFDEQNRAWYELQSENLELLLVCYQLKLRGPVDRARSSSN